MNIILCVSVLSFSCPGPTRTWDCARSCELMWLCCVSVFGYNCTSVISRPLYLYPQCIQPCFGVIYIILLLLPFAISFDQTVTLFCIIKTCTVSKKTYY